MTTSTSSSFSASLLSESSRLAKLKVWETSVERESTSSEKVCNTRMEDNSRNSTCREIYPVTSKSKVMSVFLSSERVYAFLFMVRCTPPTTWVVNVNKSCSDSSFALYGFLSMCPSTSGFIMWIVTGLWKQPRSATYPWRGDPQTTLQSFTKACLAVWRWIQFTHEVRNEV